MTDLKNITYGVSPLKFSISESENSVGGTLSTYGGGYRGSNGLRFMLRGEVI